MNVVLIQPPDLAMPALGVGCGADPKPYFSPPWNLLCLHAYLRERTRYHATLIDCRLFRSVDAELMAAVEAVPQPRFFFIHMQTVNLAESFSIVDLLRRYYPEARIAVFGQHPSCYPEFVENLPRVDFAIAGDPEPIIRNLLDFSDVEQRLNRVPGLIFKGRPNPKPYWLSDLRAFSLPDWQGIFWRAYSNSTDGAVRAEMRISRGHTRCPADRAMGDFCEPFRLWPMERAVASLLKCGHQGISEVFLSDPPGIWTPTNLHEWCKALHAVRNTQPWSLQLLPTYLDEDTLENMSASLCRRVEFLFPSCHPDVLEHYGCIISPFDLSEIHSQLMRHGIQVNCLFWMGGPEEPAGEEERIVRFIRALNYAPFRMEPFPMLFDAPLYKSGLFPEGTPALEQWLSWTKSPWMLEKPTLAWGGKPQLDAIYEKAQDIAATVTHSPGRVLKQVLAHVRSTNWIRVLEDRTLRAFSHLQPRGTS